MAPVATLVAVALGSNLGDRAAHLQFGVERLGTQLGGLRLSRFRETQAWGGAQEPDYLNAAVVGETTLGPLDFLESLLAIERDRGRERPYSNAPRTLDLDLILYGVEIITTERLHVPHPRFRGRMFVLEPLADLLPHALDPVSGKTMSQLWAEFASR